MRSWPTMTRLTSNITRSSADASAAGVWTCWTGHGDSSLRGSAAGSTVRDEPVRLPGCPMRPTTAALLGEGLPRRRDRRPELAQPEAARRGAGEALAGLRRARRPPRRLPARRGFLLTRRESSSADHRRRLSRRWRTSSRSGWTKSAASMPWPACLPATAARMISAEFGVGRAGAQRPAQVGLGLREQAGAQLAVGGEPQPVAVAAERPGDRRDDADPARPARPGVAVRAVDARRTPRPARCRVAPRGREHELARRAAPGSRRRSPCPSRDQVWSASSGMCSMKRSR